MSLAFKTLDEEEETWHFETGVVDVDEPEEVRGADITGLVNEVTDFTEAGTFEIDIWETSGINIFDEAETSAADTAVAGTIAFDIIEVDVVDEAVETSIDVVVVATTKSDIVMADVVDNAVAVDVKEALTSDIFLADVVNKAVATSIGVVVAATTKSDIFVVDVVDEAVVEADVS